MKWYEMMKWHILRLWKLLLLSEKDLLSSLFDQEDIPKDTSTEDNLGMGEGGERLTKVWTLNQLKHLQIKSETTYFLFY